MTGYVFADSVSGAPTLSGKTLRVLAGALMPKLSTRPLGGRSGVSAGTPTVVTATSATSTVKAHSGVLDVSGATDGPTPYAFDADVTTSMTAADQNNPRIDLVCVTHNDSNENDNTTTAPACVITYVTGVAASTPVAPATPPRSFVLAQLNVPKLNNGSPTVTMVAPFTVASGGIVPVRGTGEYPASPYVGQYIDDATLGLMRWDGTTWQRYGKTDWTPPTAVGVGITASTSVPPGVMREGRIVIVRGIITAAFVANGSPTGAVITLPAGFRPGTPVIRDGLAATNSVNAFVRGTVNPDGTVIIQNGSAGPAATGIDLSGLSSFIAEN